MGAQLAERHTKDRARFADSTEVVLFVCKEFWPAAFGKRVDSLKTNNKGTFVLTDNAFRWTRHVAAVGPSADAGESARRAVAAEHARVPAGMLTGFLATLGYPAEVEGLLRVEARGCMAMRPMAMAMGAWVPFAQKN